MRAVSSCRGPGRLSLWLSLTDGVISHLSWPQVLTQVLTDSVLLVGALGVLFFILKTLPWPQKHLAHLHLFAFF